VCDDDARGELRRETVVDLLALESREHPIRRRGGDELPLRKKREERPDRMWRRPVVLGVVERDVEVRRTQLIKRGADRVLAVKRLQRPARDRSRRPAAHRAGLAVRPERDQPIRGDRLTLSRRD